MYRLHHTLSILLLAGLCSCEPPGEIQIKDGDNGVEVTSLVQPDTVFGFSPIDTSALLPNDQIGFDGSFLVNTVTYDGGNGIISFSYATAFIADPTRPVPGYGPLSGYHGFHLGDILLNGRTMIERTHTVEGVDSSVSAGFEYVSWPGFSYEAGSRYTWTVDSLAGASMSEDAPAVLVVTEPRGGAVVLRSESLHLSWESDGETTIVVSRILLIGRPRPLLSLRPKHEGYAEVSSKVLELLPLDGPYLLTFIRANRKEIPVRRSFLDGAVLIQAASVHNIVIELR